VARALFSGRLPRSLIGMNYARACGGALELVFVVPRDSSWTLILQAFCLRASTDCLRLSGLRALFFSRAVLEGALLCKRRS